VEDDECEAAGHKSGSTDFSPIPANSETVETESLNEEVEVKEELDCETTSEIISTCPDNTNDKISDSTSNSPLPVEAVEFSTSLAEGKPFVVVRFDTTGTHYDIFPGTRWAMVPQASSFFYR